MSDEYEDTYAEVDEDDPNRRDDADLDEGDDDDANTITAASARAVPEYPPSRWWTTPTACVRRGHRRPPRHPEVHVTEGDMGRVIGKRGRVANAIRTVVRRRRP